MNSNEVANKKNKELKYNKTVSTQKNRNRLTATEVDA